MRMGTNARRCFAGGLSEAHGTTVRRETATRISRHKLPENLRTRRGLARHEQHYPHMMHRRTTARVTGEKKEKGTKVPRRGQTWRRTARVNADAKRENLNRESGQRKRELETASLRGRGCERRHATRECALWNTWIQPRRNKNGKW
ncbi:hypothetical protein TRVL_06168 [Trypanosoma vivax]|nr:hypothetical protein TRVL_06168 [Trypanosoma vivax]